MTSFMVGFDSKWQGTFDDEAEAISWAHEVAATGRTVEVARRRFGFCKFVTGFPESEREALAARWKRPPIGPFGDGGTSGGGTAEHHYGHAHGGHGGGGGGHGHGGGHGG